VIENDDQNFNVDDCLTIHQAVGIPIVFDVFHHSILPDNSSLPVALARTAQTWSMTDGIPMVDYSSPALNQSVGKHCQSIDLVDFKNFLQQTKPIDFDIMLEIKDKEQSALHALTILNQEPRFQRVFNKE
jgi:UV DNA damage endonuclease